MKYVLVLIFALFAMPCTAQSAGEVSAEIIVYRLPDPERLYIYRNGSVVYDAVIPENGIIRNTFILPENIQLDSLTISQAGRRIYSYSTQIGEVLVMLRSGERPDLVRVLQIHIPDVAPGVPLEVKYGVRNSGLSWDFILDMEIAEQNLLECALVAAIKTERELPGTTQSILARRPEIILASSRNILLEDTGTMFDLGRPVVEANRRMLIKLDEGKTPYRLVYLWDANRRERPAVYLRAPMPFKTMAERVQPYLNSSGLSVASLSAINISPDRSFDFYIGEQPNIVTYKSVTTAEYPERENLPFTHALEYRVTNQLNRGVSIEVSVPVTYGEKHRTEYHFTKSPDERLGDQMVWKYDLAPGAQAKVEFSFDSESKSSPLYSQFDYNEGGR
ncbi:MAG: hypothetical protein LBK13_05120 [Spirochaetales bacterium]|jgi:hypothetical protein|nr:hypothetical protein [Spirochaetales bacterium]